MSWDDFLDIGKTEFKKDEDFVTSSIDQIKSEDVAPDDLYIWDYRST